jgi:hypothetical protein
MLVLFAVGSDTLAVAPFVPFSLARWDERVRGVFSTEDLEIATPFVMFPSPLFVDLHRCPLLAFGKLGHAR